MCTRVGVKHVCNMIQKLMGISILCITNTHQLLLIVIVCNIFYIFHLCNCKFSVELHSTCILMSITVKF